MLAGLAETALLGSCLRGLDWQTEHSSGEARIRSASIPSISVRVLVVIETHATYHFEDEILMDERSDWVRFYDGIKVGIGIISGRDGRHVHCRDRGAFSANRAWRT